MELTRLAVDPLPTAAELKAFVVVARNLACNDPLSLSTSSVIVVDAA
jgi:hypothetical protein